jgi:hypothetical protein
MGNRWTAFTGVLTRVRDDFVALPPIRKGLAVGAVVVVIGGLGAGGFALLGGDEDPPPPTAPVVAATATSSTTTTSTTSSTTTTTTLPVGPSSVLNGLPADDPALLERRAVAVKIDNHPNARPQSGIGAADFVYELLVEGGLSRFIAVFHDNDSDYLGPIRSGRPTDPTLIRPTGGVMVYSGAQDWVQSIIVNAGVRLVGEGDGTFRIGSRSAPHNLYGDTLALRAVADSRSYPNDPPPPFFEIGEFAGVEPAAQVSTVWDSANRVTWLWNGDSYLRYTNELPHNEVDVDGNETQIATDVLIVLTAERYTARPPGEGTAVPALETVGSGTAFVFAGGMVAEGQWARDDIAEPFRLTDGSGAVLVVPAGRPWVAVFPTSETVTWLAEVAP